MIETRPGPPYVWLRTSDAMSTSMTLVRDTIDSDTPPELFLNNFAGSPYEKLFALFWQMLKTSLSLSKIVNLIH